MIEGMSQNMIIDPVPNNRSTLSHQLTQLDDKSSVILLKDFYEGKKRILTPPPFEGLIFMDPTGDMDGFTEFMQILRKSSPAAVVIAVVEKIGMDEMRRLISFGVDQILLRPFSAVQLGGKITAAVNFRKQVLNDEASMKGDTFDAKIKEISGNIFKINISGYLNENCELPKVLGQTKDSVVFIDCEYLKGINSVGIRSWILWLKDLEAQGFQRFEFENMHPPVLQQASFVQGFLPNSGTVNSFYLHYYCEDLDQEKEFKLVLGRDYNADRMMVPKIREEIVDSKNISYELDGSVQKLLKFFKGKIEFT